MKDKELIFGAPGCGKTTYLMTLLDQLLANGVPPEEIAFVSFTKKGAYEGRDRAMERFNMREERFPYFRTIHSLAFRYLGVSKYEMLSRKHYKDFSKAMGMNFFGYYTEDLINNDDKYLFLCSLRKNNPTMFSRLLDEVNYNRLINVYNNYDRFKKELGILDFDDLLIDFINSNVQLPVKFAIIDEAQDLTTLQWEFCEKAFKDCEKVFIAGDDDQAIYEWSGADIPKFLSLTKDGNSSAIKILDKSFRLKENILDFSKLLSSKITDRVDKQFAPMSGGGKIYYYNSIEDISINSEETYYFLSRNNCFLKNHESFLMKNGVLYNTKKGLSVPPSLLKDIKRYEELRTTNPELIRNDLSLQGKIKKDIPIKAFPTVPWFDAFVLDISMSNYLRDLYKNKVDTKDVKITVSTIHGVKGGEADNVVLFLDMTKNVHNSLSCIESMDSEFRCLYVALTRAKKNLHIVYSTSKFGYDQLVEGLKDGLCRR